MMENKNERFHHKTELILLKRQLIVSILLCLCVQSHFMDQMTDHSDETPDEPVVKPFEKLAGLSGQQQTSKPVYHGEYYVRLPLTILLLVRLVST